MDKIKGKSSGMRQVIISTIKHHIADQKMSILLMMGLHRFGKYHYLEIILFLLLK